MVDYIKSRNSPAPPRSAPWRRPARETEVSGLSLVYVGFLVSLSVWTQQSKGRFRLRLDSGGSRGGWTYVSERVQVVVGQLQLLEGDELPHPMGSGSGRVRVDVQPPGHRGLRLARHRPTTTAPWRHRHTTAPWRHRPKQHYNNSTMTSQTYNNSPVTSQTYNNSTVTTAPWRHRPTTAAWRHRPTTTAPWRHRPTTTLLWRHRPTTTAPWRHSRRTTTPWRQRPTTTAS